MVLVYDESFEGLLTAIFEVFEYKFSDAIIQRKSSAQTPLFAGLHEVYTSPEKAKRVEIKLREKLSKQGWKNFFAVYLSEKINLENILLRYSKYLLRCPNRAEFDFGDPDVLFVQQTSRQVYRERHRMEAFIRFQLTADGIYFARIQPDFNVIPLLVSHFQERYADQKWLIYDLQRHYGIYYDGNTVEDVEINFSVPVQDSGALEEHMAPGEDVYEKCWQQYFYSTSIEARKNTKLHIRHVPRRYWKYLTEKKLHLG